MSLTAPHSQAPKQQTHFTGLTTIIQGQPVTNTRKIASAIDADNKEVVNVVKTLLEDYPELRGDTTAPKIPEFEPVFIEYQAEYRGQTFTAYQMNEAAFYLLLPRFRTPRAKTAYLEFVKSFMQMKQALLQAEANKDNLLFNQIRIEGKQARRNLTDALAEFADYAENQGSKGRKWLFSNVTKQINKAIGLQAISCPSARDAMTTEQAEQLKEVEQLMTDLLHELMEAKTPYKEIKAEIKALCEEFAA